MSATCTAGGWGIADHLHSIRKEPQGPGTGSQERCGVFVSALKSHQNGVSDQEKEWKGGGLLPVFFSSQRPPWVGAGLAGMATSLVSPLARENMVQGEAAGSQGPPALSAEGAPSRRLLAGKGEAPVISLHWSHLPAVQRASGGSPIPPLRGPIFLLPGSTTAGSDGTTPGGLQAPLCPAALPKPAAHLRVPAAPPTPRSITGFPAPTFRAEF